MDIDHLLERYLYEPLLVTTDSEQLLRVPLTPGYHLDEDRIFAIKTSPRFKAWFALNESSLLLMNANSDPASNLEMSFVSAQAYERAMEVSREQMNGETKLVPIAFFCSQHRDYRKDVHGSPAELAMSLLLQLVDAYHEFSPEDLPAAFDEFDPEDIESILATFGALVSRLPASAIVVLIVDGLRFFAQPKERRIAMADVVARLVDVHRQEHAAMLKFLFANSTRMDFLEEIFTDDEILHLPTDLSVEQGYNTMLWKYPVDLESPEKDRDGSNNDSEI
ncbi:hypothetical protein DL770_004184 [Monosporascus sp. CRB-9-2]|nr:hypothetical protein DL770_004184 [Monosporascus sp. CRB-9-2]